MDLRKLEEPEINSEVVGLELYSDQYPFRLPLRIKSFENEAEYTKFIRNCERQIRNSIEYKQWRNYIIDVLGVQSCMITQERMDQCTVEVHHHIPSLFVLVKSITNKMMDEEKEFSTFDISLEAIKYHFQNKVGYVALIKSMHERFHNGFLNIPSNVIKGNYQAFIEEYSSNIDDEDLDVIQQRLAVTESNCGWSRDNYPGQQHISNEG